MYVLVCLFNYNYFWTSEIAFEIFSVQCMMMMEMEKVEILLILFVLNNQLKIKLKITHKLQTHHKFITHSLIVRNSFFSALVYF